jgi:hypothetical protein
MQFSMETRMPILDNPKLEAFAQALARDVTAEKAAKDAGFSDRRDHARERAKGSKVVKRIKEIRVARKGDPDLGPVIDALMDAAAIAMTNKACESAAGLVAIRGLLAEAGKLKGFVPRTAPEDDDLMEPDLDDDAWMARFGPAAS